MTPGRSDSPKRFYDAVAVEVAGSGISITLDGRPVRTPAGALLTLPAIALAEAVAAEWDRQGERLDIPSMHLTRLANVAVDRTPETREALVAEIVRYCETDLTCFLAAEADVRARQDAAWRPWREWAGAALGIVLVPVEGLLASPQPQASLMAAGQVARGYDDFRLTGLAFACGIFGSAVLALAVAEASLDADDAFEASVVDETIQAEQWGVDAEAAAAQAARRIEARAIGDWFTALSSHDGQRVGG